MKGMNEQREDKVSHLMERNGISSRKKEGNDDRLTELEKVVQSLTPEQGSQNSDTLARLSEVERALSILLTGETGADSTN